MELDYFGMILGVNAVDVKVFSENNVAMTVDRLTKLAENHWCAYYL